MGYMKMEQKPMLLLCGLETQEKKSAKWGIRAVLLSLVCFPQDIIPAIRIPPVP